MMNENYEVMEMEETMETYTGDVEPTEEESEGGLSAGAIALAVGGVMTIGGLAVAGFRALKKKKAEEPKKEKPKKQKTKLVRVPADVDIDELLALREECLEDFEEETEE